MSTSWQSLRALQTVCGHFQVCKVAQFAVLLVQDDVAIVGHYNYC